MLCGVNNEEFNENTQMTVEDMFMPVSDPTAACLPICQYVEEPPRRR